MSATILPLATSYNVCEGLGFESGIDKRFAEAPVFYWLYTLLIGGGAGIVLIPHLPLLKFILYSQVANGILIPFVLVYMLLLVNRPRLMGSFRNKGWQNGIAWATAIVMILLTAAWIYTSLVD
jgi:Mn2+/Fe2+ NRAMP family transporter